MPPLTSAISVEPFFTEDFTQPATFTNAAGDVREIDVIFDTAYQGSFVGDTEAENARPAATCKESDVFDADNNSTLVLHDYLENEDGELITDQDGEPLVAVNVASYQVLRVNRDGTGVIVLDLKAP